MPGLRELDGLAKLRLAQRLVVAVFVLGHRIDVDVVGHDAHEAAHAERFDEGCEDVGFLFHLQRRGHPALQQLRVGERADREALLAARDRRHREVLAGHAAEPHVFGAPAEEGVADMVVGADEAGQHHLAGAVDDARGAGVRRLDLRARTYRCDTSVLDVHRAVLDHAVTGIDGENGGVCDEQTHVSLRAVTS